jgi:hypothetical protein
MYISSEVQLYGSTEYMTAPPAACQALPQLHSPTYTSYQYSRTPKVRTYRRTDVQKYRSTGQEPGPPAACQVLPQLYSHRPLEGQTTIEACSIHQDVGGGGVSRVSCWGAAAAAARALCRILQQSKGQTGLRMHAGGGAWGIRTLQPWHVAADTILSSGRICFVG